MTTELRVTINSRIDKDNNISIQFMHLVDTEAEADTYEEQDQRITMAYLAGYGRSSS